MNPWIYVVLGGFFEMIWATAMVESNGFTILPWVLVTIVFCLVSVFFLYWGMKFLPVEGCYAVWTGCGTIFSTIAGIFLFGDVLGGAEVFFLAILIGGIVLLQYSDSVSKKTE